MTIRLGVTGQAIECLDWSQTILQKELFAVQDGHVLTIERRNVFWGKDKKEF